jgi:energy-coupling factor transporter ATP-binding protein EcfA2
LAVVAVSCEDVHAARQAKWSGTSAVHLESFSVSGFRSLTDVADIPVSRPTILAGHNDGGKSAALDALAFLVGERILTDDDRTYLSIGGGEQPSSPTRCESTGVTGRFVLDAWEQEQFNLPARIEVRRLAPLDGPARLEVWGPQPDDERLRSLERLLAPELKKLVAEFGLGPTSMLKPDLLAALRTYARDHSGEHAWLPAPAGLSKRMPRYLPFDGKAARPDEAVKAALTECFQSHVAASDVKEKLSVVEEEVKDRLRIDAESLCKHIQARCPDLAEVAVAPEVSFQHGFRGAPLRISQAAGEAVGLERSGLGRNRRVSLAVWEWTSKLLADEEDTASQATDPAEPPQPGPVQTIVVYDEPDTHLDYGHQRKIMALIREQSALPHVSVLVATHSMNLIDGVDISDVVHLKLDNHRTVVERLGAGTVGGAVDDHLGKIAAAVGLRNSVLLHERCFLAVEGETEQRAFPLLFRLCEGLTLQAAGVALWSCSNNEGALHLARYLIGRGRTVMLVVDADSRNVSKSIFKSAKLTQFFGGGVSKHVKFLGEPEDGAPEADKFNELEEIFTDEVWARVANRIWAKPNPDQAWAEADFSALRGQGKFSSDVQQMLQAGSPDGPGGKPEMMYELSMALTDPAEVPEQLRSVFAEVRALAK